MDIAETVANKAYQKVIIYYFSGTGNSRNVAKWLGTVAQENQIESRVIDISRIGKNSLETADSNTLIVFISAIHGFNYPPIMLKFIRQFPSGKNKVILMNTRAGMLIGKFITPGVTGIAFYLSALILYLKGYSIKAILPVDMPSNWISLHPGLNERTVKYLHEKNKLRVETFARKILQGKTHFKALFEFYDLLFTPIAIGYYAVGRFILAKTFYASSDCNDCKICINSCPVKAISKVNGKHFWTFKCESCMKCMSNCPKKAIETGHGFLGAFVYIFFSVIIVLFYNYFPIENNFAKFIIESALFLVLIGIWYRFIHLLLRFKRFERLIVYSSLTKYKWWGRRYKAL